MRRETVIDAAPWVFTAANCLLVIGFLIGPVASLLLGLVALMVQSVMMGALLSHRPPRPRNLQTLLRMTGGN